MEVFIGTILLFGGNFAPRGWALCNGQIMSIAQNSALFSILGTTYGGDGVQTFALPDLRGRAALGWGNGPGLTPRDIGEQGGSENTTLTINNMPAHNHTLAALNASADQTMPTGNYLAGEKIYTERTDTTLNAQAVGVTGGSQPISIMPPFLTLNYIIALEGIYPSRG